MTAELGDGEALRRGIAYEKIHEITKIDVWFIDKLAILVEMEQRLKQEELTTELLKEAKRINLPPDKVIAELSGRSEEEIHDLRYENGIVAAYKMGQIPVRQNLRRQRLVIIGVWSENEAEKTGDREKRCLSWIGCHPRLDGN